MLNVIALRPAEKNQLKVEIPTPNASTLRHHVLKQLSEEKSGRLDCGDDMDIEVPTLDIYAAR